MLAIVYKSRVTLEGQEENSVTLNARNVPFP